MEWSVNWRCCVTWTVLCVATNWPNLMADAKRRTRNTATMASKMPLVAPVYLPGQEPLPPGISEEDRMQIMQSLKYQGYIVKTMESCVGKAAISGVLGFGLGAFFSLMSASLSIDDPLRQTMIDKAAAEKARKLEEEREAAKKKSSAPNARSSTTRSHTNTTQATPRLTTEQLNGISNTKIGSTTPATRTQAFLTKLPGGNYFKNLPLHHRSFRLPRCRARRSFLFKRAAACIAVDGGSEKLARYIRALNAALKATARRTIS